MSYRILLLSAFIAAPGFAATISGYAQQNLVSDLPNVAQLTDPGLVNPWGIVQGPTPFWISDNGMGLSTLYTGAGAKISLSGPDGGVTVPSPSGLGATGTPTGVIFNGNASAFGGAPFIFSTEDGTIATWSGGAAAVQEVNNSPGSVYKGLATLNNTLYATNFRTGQVDMFDSSFALAGSFTDPTVPAGYAPFGIAAFNNQLYVTFALQDGTKHDDVAGAGHGFVDIFNPDGTFVNRLISMGSLNSPWGLALAPSSFGQFGGDLLVGNFGNGWINAFNPMTGAFIGSLMDSNGNPIVNDGLWGLAFGNGSVGAGTNTLYFTAGLDDEQHGLFGRIDTPEPGTFLLAGVLLAVFMIGARARRAA